MTNKRYFLFVWILIFIGLMGVSCFSPVSSYPLTPTPVIVASVTPSITPSPTLVSLMILTYPTAIPYPTASVVKSNAVAFIAENALWVANVDGSGERKLTDIQNNESWTSSYLLKWSPDGKWIGYISGNDLWVISPDGSNSKKVIGGSDADNKNTIWSYSWSPDGSEIAYIQTIKGKPTPRLLNLGTGNVFDLPISTDQLSLSWSPDGQYILLNTYTALTIFEVNTSRVLKEISLYGYNHCAIEHGGVTWSPNSKWFYHLVFANGTYALQICLSGLDGSDWYIEDVGYIISPPVWDKTGEYLYFVAGKMDLNIGANWFTNQRLMRYNVKARKSEELLSLEEDGSMGFPPIIFLSPNGQKLGLYMYAYHENNLHYVDTSQPKKCTFVIVDIQSLSTKKFDIETNIQDQILAPGWSPDNRKIIFYDGFFYFLDITTGKFSLFSGKHAVESVQVSPIVTTP